MTPSVMAAIRSGLKRPEILPLNRLPTTIPSPASIIISIILLSAKPETLSIKGLI